MSIISNYSIGYGVVFYDHLPLHFDITVSDMEFQYISCDDLATVAQNYPRINWDKINDNDKNIYATVLDDLCSDMQFEVLNCRTEHCRNSHAMQLDTFYKDLLDRIFAASLVLTCYDTENSDVHAAFIDMSKAFDRINKNILIEKLKKTSLNPLIIRSIHVMYDSSYVNTSFNGTKSEYWQVGNGVRQGGILSTHLFCYCSSKFKIYS